MPFCTKFAGMQNFVPELSELINLPTQNKCLLDRYGYHSDLMPRRLSIARNKVGNGAGQSLGSNVINWVLDYEHHLLSKPIKFGLATQERKKIKKKDRKTFFLLFFLFFKHRKKERKQKRKKERKKERKQTSPVELCPRLT